MKDLTSLAETFGIECYEDRGDVFVSSVMAESLDRVFKTLRIKAKFGEEVEAIINASITVLVRQVFFDDHELVLKIAAFWKRNFGRGTYAIPDYPDQVLNSKCKGMGLKVEPGDKFWDVYRGYVSVVASHLYVAEGAIIRFVQKEKTKHGPTGATQDEETRSENEEDIA